MDSGSKDNEQGEVRLSRQRSERNRKKGSGQLEELLGAGQNKTRYPSPRITSTMTGPESQKGDATTTTTANNNTIIIINSKNDYDTPAGLLALQATAQTLVATLDRHARRILAALGSDRATPRAEAEAEAEAVRRMLRELDAVRHRVCVGKAERPAVAAVAVEDVARNVRWLWKVGNALGDLEVWGGREEGRKEGGRARVRGRTRESAQPHDD
ncbi:hypothetical protein MYCTH_2111341 [Thermothelomyces thermophilus ATCC 42464]|uniref:Uncharacterized protein n=1 Tax=Thermothelomyces thermophilus (strain ATCC 42464 / BCRC 31852 / DSM 1799) TaxID=573729 RepID=G2QF80_THET4|nr:uncharacterized protein MYCTH_2111341 [Thermothelomyces thermophilus ATCC 42464]AEO59109.1 hypothetical protein MYCTH_2111341 [Thermothelomyces thermophilus ATCC 42464]